MSNSFAPTPAGSPVRVVVIGLGHLGSYHLDKLAAMDDAQVVAVVDTDAAKARKVAEKFKAAWSVSIATLSISADAAIVASPTQSHESIACEALSRGWHILVEKPLCESVAAARRVVAQAKACNRICQVGHTERFNPAVAAALAIADRPRYIVAERLGPFSGRSTDVDVVLDLMIHDLDIVASIVSAEAVEIRATGVPVLTPEVDMASARIAFADGTVAQLSAGRASMQPCRKLRLFTVKRYLSVDCMRREVKSVRRDHSAASGGWPEITGEPVDVPPTDALAAQDAHFIQCVRSGARPRVDGEAGVRALALAEGVKAAMAIPLANL